MLLQAAKTKALDVINSLGLSDSLLRVIERRQKMDKYITYGGMVREFTGMPISHSSSLLTHQTTQPYGTCVQQRTFACVFALSTSLSGTDVLLQ